MGSFIFSLILIALAIVAFVFVKKNFVAYKQGKESALEAKRAEVEDDSEKEKVTIASKDLPDRVVISRNIAQILGAAAAFMGLLGTFILISHTIITVSTKNIGVVTQFGKPVGKFSNGIHVKKPWEKVTELDGAIQIESNTGDNSTQVRLGNNSTARVENSVRWRLNPERVDQLFADYRNFEAIKENLVTRETTAALNEVMADYNPLNDENMRNPTKGLSILSEKVADNLKKRVQGDVIILNVIIPIVHFDEPTQSRINAYQAEIANTRIAHQKEQTAAAEAEVNRRLQRSLTREALQNKCLDISRATGQPALGCLGVPGGIITRGGR